MDFAVHAGKLTSTIHRLVKATKEATQRGATKMTGTLWRNPHLSTRGVATTFGVILALLVCWRVGHALEPEKSAELSTIKADFGDDGKAHLPRNFRQWEHVGTRVKTSGKSILDGSVILRPQVLDTYVEPSAFSQYKKNGRWPDGTQIVKEISVIRTGKDCDKITFACSIPAGVGIFEDSFIGVGLMVKDSRRFPDAPGHWAYFRFLPNGTTYAATSAVMPVNQCQSCHVNFASQEDYVFTDTHIGLNLEGAAGS